MQFTDLNPQQLHHAYVVISVAPENTKKDIEQFVTNDLNLAFHGNPDVFLGEYESIGIDDLADVVSMHQRVPLGEKKIIILLANGLTLQAQNSILKMIEEPTPNTHFFISLPSISILLPTVLSRVHILESGRQEGEEYKIDQRVARFIKAAAPQRLEIVKEVMGELDKEKISKEDVIQLISSIVEAVHAKNKDKETLLVLNKVTDYLRDQSSSLKMLFEYLALRLPLA